MTEPDSELLHPYETPAESFPWPPEENASALDAFVNTWRESVFHPTSFFRRMPREGHYGYVVGYYLVVGVIAAGIELFWRTVFGLGGLGGTGFWSLGDTGSDPVSAMIGFLLSPIVLLCALYLVTGVCHLMLLMMRGSRHGFETSSRVFAFSYGTAVFAVVPFLGTIAGFVWMTVISIIGLREAQQTDGAKAAVAVLVPMFLLVSIMVLAVIAGAMLGVLGTRI